jgi:hypothetical protein
MDMDVTWNMDVEVNMDIEMETDTDMDLYITSFCETMKACDSWN